MKEFRDLPDEFNRNYKEEHSEEKKKTSWFPVLSAVIAITIALILPNAKTSVADTVNVPTPPVEPDIEDIDVIEEEEPYDIIGLWEANGTYYNFFEDGSGYYYNGEIFILLNWEEDGSDYSVQGGGLTAYDAYYIEEWSTDQETLYEDGVLYLSHDSMDTLGYVRSSDAIPDSNVLPLLQQTKEERASGFWEAEQTLSQGGDFLVYPSYVLIEDGMLKSDIGNSMTGAWAHFEGSTYWESESHMLITGPFEYGFSSGNSSWTYTTENFSVYFFITEEGEKIITDFFGDGRTILYKE